MRLSPPLNLILSEELLTSTSTDAVEKVDGFKANDAMSVKVYFSPPLRVPRGTNSLGVLADSRLNLMRMDETSH